MTSHQLSQNPSLSGQLRITALQIEPIGTHVSYYIGFNPGPLALAILDCAKVCHPYRAGNVSPSRKVQQPGWLSGDCQG